MFGNSIILAIVKLPRIGIMENGISGLRRLKHASTHSRPVANIARKTTTVFSTIGEDEMSKNVFYQNPSESASQDKPRRSLSPKSKTTRATSFHHTPPESKPGGT